MYNKNCIYIYKQNYTIINQNRNEMIWRGVPPIPLEEYAPNKIAMKIVIFVEFGTVLTIIGQCQIQNFHFSWDLIDGGNVVCNFKFITSETNLLNHLMYPTIIKISYWSLDFYLTVFHLTLAIN